MPQKVFIFYHCTSIIYCKYIIHSWSFQLSAFVLADDHLAEDFIQKDYQEGNLWTPEAAWCSLSCTGTL